MIKKTFALLLVIIAFSNCTKDDICSGDTLTTPFLVVEFRDVSNRLETKEVESLRILINDEDTTEVYISAETDTLVSIPLNTLTTNSSFQFIFNNNNNLDEDDTTVSNTDIISFNYSTQDIYVNRACAFRRTYADLLVDLEQETNNENWIKDTEILNNIIVDEDEAHITIFH